MSASNYSKRIEALLRQLRVSYYGKSDEIFLNPYKEIVSALEYRVPKEKLDKFKLYYQAINGQSLQELIDDDYDVDLLMVHIRELINNNGEEN